MATKVFDLHCDTLDKIAWPTLPHELNCGRTYYAPQDKDLVEKGVLQDFKTSSGHLSLDAMGVFEWCQCLGVFIPDELDAAESARFFDAVSATLPRHLEQHPDQLAVARDASEIEGTLASGCSCGLLTIENGKLLAASEDMFDHIVEKGVKMVTLTWNAENPLGSGHDTHHGLTDFGRHAVTELERRRVVVDVSHLNDEGFWDVAAYAKRPFAASHSNLRAVRDVPRNLTDDEFRAIRDAGGIVGINYCRSFISAAPDPSPDELLAHIERMLDLGGEKVIALGSDYDGCDVPSWLSPCSKVADLAELLARHFGQEQTERIMFSNAHEFFLRNDRD